jgi:hypothetical protein
MRTGSVSSWKIVAEVLKLLTFLLFPSWHWKLSFRRPRKPVSYSQSGFASQEVSLYLAVFETISCYTNLTWNGLLTQVSIMLVQLCIPELLTNLRHTKILWPSCQSCHNQTFDRFTRAHFRNPYNLHWFTLDGFNLISFSCFLVRDSFNFFDSGFHLATIILTNSLH